MSARATDACPAHRRQLQRVANTMWLVSSRVRLICDAHGRSPAPPPCVQAFEEASVVEIAAKHKVTAAQVLGRWCVQHGFIYIPKSVRKER